MASCNSVIANVSDHLKKVHGFNKKDQAITQQMTKKAKLVFPGMIELIITKNNPGFLIDSTKMY